jgi:hypothetical protein
LLLEAAIPSLRGAHGAKAPLSKPPFVIVGRGQMDMDEVELRLVRVEVANDVGTEDVK